MNNKICRICWNTKNWQKPSKDAKKIEYEKTFAATYGFGHEEWLFDYSMLIDGYKYSFLQPIGKHYGKYAGSSANILLYTTNAKKQRLIVGVIKDAYIPTIDEVNRIQSIFHKNGWVEKMKKDCTDLGIDNSYLSTFDHENFINIRFFPESVEYFDPMPEVDQNHKIYTNSRYQLFDWDDDIPIIDKDYSTNARSEENRLIPPRGGNTYSPKHIILQNKIFKLLKSIYGNSSVDYEKDNIDLAVETTSGKILIEIKTAKNVKYCIREAIGQILEYNHYPNEIKSKTLIIMSDISPSSEDIEYIQHLKALYNLPIYYSFYDGSKNSLENWPTPI